VKWHRRLQSEHPDLCRRRHQVRCLLCQGHDQERDRHQRRLAELCDVWRQRLRLPGHHNWNPYWSSRLFGSYSAVRYDGGANDNLLGARTSSAKGGYCAAFAASHSGQAPAGNAAGNYTCNPDFNVSQLGVITRWTPVKNLTFSGEVQWFPSRSEDVGLFGVYGECSEADGAL
jgi:hypothetical protein